MNDSGELQLLDGCAAITESAVAAGCRFFAGYPISPFTGLLENMSKRLPLVDGICVNAESEIEGVNMALGASAAGTRSATGSSSTWPATSRTTSRRPGAVAGAITAP
jgi:2-oxoglutarate ferredoxin oxidoreductase subunit alpha